MDERLNREDRHVAQHPDDRTIRKYLLNQLSAEDREPIEEQLLRSPELFERIEEYEDSLILAHIKGDLDHETNQRFIQIYKLNPVRNQRVEVLEALVQEAASRRKEPVPAAKASTAWLNWRNVLAGAALAGALGAFFFTDAMRPIPATPVAVHKLLPGTIRDAAAEAPRPQIVPKPDNRGLIRLILEEAGDPRPGSYAAISSPDSQETLVREVRIDPATKQVSVDIDSRDLPPGDYRLELAVPGGEVVQSFQFRTQ